MNSYKFSLSFSLFIALGLLPFIGGYYAYSQTRDVVVVYFEADTEKIGPRNKEKVKQKIQSVKQATDYTIILEGYSDITGRADYNLRLSKERAELVKDYLLELGVDPDRIQVYGKGGTDKYAAGENEEALARNRRVNMIVEIVPEPVAEETLPPAIEIIQEELASTSPSNTESDIDDIQEPTPQTQSEPLSAILDKLEKTIRRNTANSILFTTPKQMQLGESYEIEAEVSYAFIESISKDLDSSQIGDNVGLVLSGSGFSVSDSELEVKKLEKNSPSIWQWEVIPDTEGRRSLILSVAIGSENALLNDGYPIFNRVIDVKPSMIHSISSSYWVMGILILFIVAIVGWILVSKIREN
ncbi:MAG: OmpA family protein [Thermodesulfobacteriota bacterium]